MANDEIDKYVVLKYANNECCVQVVTLKEAMKLFRKEIFSVDPSKGTWTYGGHEFKIGRMRECERGCRGGVIGVYDRSDTKHLNFMASDAIEAVKSDYKITCD